MDPHEIEALSYRELQKLAKEHGLKANGKKEDLKHALIAKLCDKENTSTDKEIETTEIYTVEEKPIIEKPAPAPVKQPTNPLAIAELAKKESSRSKVVPEAYGDFPLLQATHQASKSVKLEFKNPKQTGVATVVARPKNLPASSLVTTPGSTSTSTLSSSSAKSSVSSNMSSQPFKSSNHVTSRRPMHHNSPTKNGSFDHFSPNKTYVVNKYGDRRPSFLPLIDNSNNSSPRRSLSFGRLLPSEIKPYFNSEHSKLDLTFENIEEREKRHRERRRSLSVGCSPRIAELAKPKSPVRESPVKFTPTAVDKVDFGFSRLSIGPGGDSPLTKFSASSSNPSNPVNAAPSKPKRVAARRDVKQMTTAVHRNKDSVNPANLRRYQYVDTTAMTDAEFQEYRAKMKTRNPSP